MINVDVYLWCSFLSSIGYMRPTKNSNF